MYEVIRCQLAPGGAVYLKHYRFVYFKKDEFV